MKQQLLSALGELEPVSIEGVFEHHCSLRRDPLAGSAAGGRWGAPGAFEVLYLGRPDDSVVIEAYRHLVDDELGDPAKLAAQVSERRIVTLSVAVTNILDLRDAAAQEKADLTASQLHSGVGDYGACQSVGAAAHQLGYHGVLAPAAEGSGETLALFALNLPAAESPTVVSQDIWRGLPADPRRLRLVENDQ